MELGGCVYIITNDNHTVLYIGVTSDLLFRVIQHRTHVFPQSFTARYNCHKLIYYEQFTTIEEAIGREKQLKKWNRVWKEKLIESGNPHWKDLFDEI